MQGLEGISGGEGLGALASVGERGAPMRAGESFAELFQRRVGVNGAGDETEVVERTRQAAEEFVAIGLVQPILASMREMNNAAPPFAPGAAERRFGPMLDAEIAQRIVQSANFEVVDSVARQLLRAQGPSVPADPARGVEVDRHG